MTGESSLNLEVPALTIEKVKRKKQKDQTNKKDDKGIDQKNEKKKKGNNIFGKCFGKKKS